MVIFCTLDRLRTRWYNYNMKKNILVLFLFALIIPSVAFASWWNPFSWKIFHKREIVQPKEIKLQNDLMDESIIIPTQEIENPEIKNNQDTLSSKVKQDINTHTSVPISTPKPVVLNTNNNQTQLVKFNSDCPVYAWSTQNYEWDAVNKKEIRRKIVPSSDHNIIMAVLISINNCSKDSIILLPDLTINFTPETNLSTTLTNIRLTDQNGNALSEVIPKIILPDSSVYNLKILKPVKLDSPDHTTWIQIRATSGPEPIPENGYYGIQLNTASSSTGVFWPRDYGYSYGEPKG